jgi:hypothetical protein
MKQVRFTWMIMGNILEEDAKKIVLEVQGIFASTVLP